MNLSLRTKITLGFGALLVILCVVAGVTYKTVGLMRTANEQVSQNYQKKLKIAEIAAGKRDQAVLVRNLLLTHEPSEEQAFRKSIVSETEKFDELDKMLQAEEGHKKLANLRALDKKHTEAFDKAVALIRTGMNMQAYDHVLKGEMNTSRGNELVALEDLSEFINKLMENANREEEVAQARGVTTVLTLAVAGVILGALVALFIGRTISKSLQSIVDRVKDIAQGEGDLTRRLEISSKDEIGEVAKWFNMFMDKLQDVVSKVGANTGGVATSSEELSAVSNQMSNNARDTASQVSAVSAAAEEINRNLQTVATGTEQMSASIKEIA